MTQTSHTDVDDQQGDQMTDTMDVEAPKARAFDGIDVCARRFALGWRAVISAASNDEERQALYHTVFVEQFDNGVILVATNSYLLLWTWIGVDEVAQQLGPPDHDEQPLSSVLLRDTSGLPAALFNHVIKCTGEKGNIDRGSELNLSFGRIEAHPDRPSLSAELDQPALIARFWREAVAIPVVEGLIYPAWRSALDVDKATGVRRIGLASDFLKAVASVRVDERQPIDFEMLGVSRGVNFTINGDPKVYGRLMPAVSNDD